MKFLIAAALAAVPPGALAAEDAERGHALYELHCLGCHGQSVHSRPKRVATDLAAVRAWVARWNEAVGARWSPDEVDQVTIYLNARYYRYPCPPTLCRVVSMARPVGAN